VFLLIHKIKIKTIMKKAMGTAHAGKNTFMVASLLKFMVFITISLATVSQAKAQHCDGCSVNLMGPEVVHVGQTATYTVNTLWPDQPHYVYWDGFYNLTNFGTIIDQGINASGQEYATIYFFNSGYTWVTFEAFFDGHAYNYDELPISIYP
jgi:hypothetical protein